MSLVDRKLFELNSFDHKKITQIYCCDYRMLFHFSICAVCLGGFSKSTQTAFDALQLIAATGFATGCFFSDWLFCIYSDARNFSVAVFIGLYFIGC